MSSRSNSVEATADTILAFLAHQPDRADTAENIRRWWLSRHGSANAGESVQEALDYLERSGDVEKASMEGGQMLYQKVAD